MTAKEKERRQRARLAAASAALLLIGSPQDKNWTRKVTADPMTDRSEVAHTLVGEVLDGSARHPTFIFACANQSFVRALYDADKSIAGEQDSLVPSMRNYFLRIRFGKGPASRESVGVDSTGHRISFPVRIVRDIALHETVTFQFLGVDG